MNLKSVLKTFFFLLCLWNGCVLNAQLLQQQNSIFYLHNGSVYIGEVLDDKTEQLSVRLFDGNEVQFSAYAVKKYLDGKNIKVFFDGRYNATNGLFFHVASGANAEAFVSDGEDDRVSSHLPLMIGRYLNHRFAVAAGIGFEFNEAELAGFLFDTQFTTTFLYGRYYLNQQKRRPFIYSRLGYGFATNDTEFDNDRSLEGGFQFQAGAGIHFSSKKKSKFILSLGYHLQNASGQQRFIDDFGGEVFADYDLLIRRLVISFGVEFVKRQKGYRQ